jgi:nucleoid-associated protein YgaU
MTDVEKYGLFALIFVVSILGLAWLLGPDDVPPANSAVSHSVVLERPSAGSTPANAAGRRKPPGQRANGQSKQAQGGKSVKAPAQRQVARYTVASLVDTASDFSFDDPPVSYPGEHSASLPTPKTGFHQHTIQKNETLSDVSRQYYGSAKDWRVILKANPGLDEMKLQVGQVVSVPRKANKGNVGNAGIARESKGLYIVRNGDTLGAIARRELGSVERTNDLFAANRDVMSSPDKLKVGMHLRIP